MKGRIGPVPGTPRIELNQPHWDTATEIPMAAARENIDVTAPMNGTSKDRNSTTSARNPRPTTTSRKIGSASASTVVKSAVIAAVPPTRMVAPVACSSAGLTSSRKVVSNSLVAASWGAVVG